MQYNQLTTKEFIEKARKIHGDKYDYSKVKYENNHTEIIIICPVHGEFKQLPSSHLQGRGCKKCYYDLVRKRKQSNTKEFIEKARKIHGDKYDYSKVKYVNSSTLVDIICPEHGVFKQAPNNHLRGQGCQMCYNERRGLTQRLTCEEFLKKAKSVHGDKYDYSEVEYINSETNVCIICHDKDKYGNEHGAFWQRPDHHLSSKCGCPKCKSKHFEEEIRNALLLNNIKFEEQKTFDWLKYDETGCHQFFDFYLPDDNAAIECQGEQHFEIRDFFGGEIEFIKTIKRDKNKLKKCEEHGIKMFYFGENKYKTKSLNENYFSNKNDLIKKIRGLI